MRVCGVLSLAQGGRRDVRGAGCGERGAVGLQQGPHPAARSDA